MEKYLAFDIGGSHVKYGLLTEKGKIINNSQIKTPHEWDKMAKEFDRIVKKNINKISGVAISSPGKIDVDKGIIYKGGAVNYLDQINIKKHFKEYYNLESSVVNDGKAVGQAELWKGNLKGVKDGVAITLGTGIGGAVIINGEVHQGHNFLAGEFSSIFSSTDSLDKKLADSNSAVILVEVLADIIGLDDKSDGGTVFEVVTSKKNKKVNKQFTEYCKSLAIFIANLQMILDVSHVVIGGGISNQDIVIEEINNQYEIIREQHFDLFDLFEPLVITRSKYSSNSNLLGALYQLLLELNKI